MTTTPLTDAPPLILIIADTALETLPAPIWNAWPPPKEARNG